MRPLTQGGGGEKGKEKKNAFCYASLLRKNIQFWALGPITLERWNGVRAHEAKRKN